MRLYNLSSRDVAYMAVFASLSAIITKLIPGFPIIGLSGSNIKFDAALAPIYGLVIGPYLGFTAAFIGGIIVANSWFSVLTSFSPAISAFIAGMLTQKNINSKSQSFPGWALAATVIGLLILGWYLTGVGQQVPLYPVLHLIGLLIILATRGKIATFFEREKETEKRWTTKPNWILAGILIVVLAFIFSKPYLSSAWLLSYISLPMYFAGGIMIIYGLFGSAIKRRDVTAGIFLASYCGIIADHMLGNLIFISTLGILIPIQDIENWLSYLNLPDVPSLFMYTVPISVAERLIFTAIATIFGVGLVLFLRRARLLPRRL